MYTNAFTVTAHHLLCRRIARPQRLQLQMERQLVWPPVDQHDPSGAHVR